MEPIACTPAALAEIIGSCLDVDGLPPLTEHKLRVVAAEAEGRLSCWGRGGMPAVAAVAAVHRQGGEVHWAVEVAVVPPARDDELAPIRLGAALPPPGETHTIWVSRDPQQEAAEALGYTAFRDLLMMTVALPVAEPRAVAGYRIRSFRPGVDEEAVARTNNQAFATHRENAQMTVETITARERDPWFDPAGFLVVEDAGDLAGFCWTKLHPGGVGEIYILGVDPAHHGRGLGRWLLLAGLDHLHRAGGARSGCLWTDGENPAIERLYRPAGFTTSLVSREMRLDQPNSWPH